MASQEALDVTSSQSVVFAPGQLIKGTISLIDAEGRIYRDENDAICTLEFEDSKGLLPAGSQILNNEQVANAGIFTFDRLSIRQKPDSAA